MKWPSHFCKQAFLYSAKTRYWLISLGFSSLLEFADDLHIRGGRSHIPILL
jgi:hypothetical protein